MEAEAAVTTLDPATTPEQRYRENARTLGYDEPSAEKLAEKWRVMLDKARRVKSA